MNRSPSFIMANVPLAEPIESFASRQNVCRHGAKAQMATAAEFKPQMRALHFFLTQSDSYGDYGNDKPVYDLPLAAQVSWPLKQGDN